MIDRFFVDTYDIHRDHLWFSSLFQKRKHRGGEKVKEIFDWSYPSYFGVDYNNFLDTGKAPLSGSLCIGI
jgi:hypothetical protein